jgi:hypothetical protein
MNWGKGLALALASFAALMAWFIVQASRSPEPLVTEQYYEQELKYQERIDATALANAIGAVRMDVSRTAVGITFPAGTGHHAISGELLLQRPNDPARDRRLRITSGPDGNFHAQGLDLAPGRYNAQLSWESNGVSYFTEERIVVQ